MYTIFIHLDFKFSSILKDIMKQNGKQRTEKNYIENIVNE